MKIIVVSGGFDPIHSGHIEYLKSAKEHGKKLIVALNSDGWLKKKKGKPFMTFNERKSILEAIQYVDEVIDFVDDKKGSCINALKKIKKLYPNDQIINPFKEPVHIIEIQYGEECIENDIQRI